MQCPTCDNDYAELRVHLNKSYPDHLPDDWTTCPSCNKWYKKLGTHWSTGECSYPEISKYQDEIITGIVMGDGWIDRDKKNARLGVGVTEREYLEWVKHQLSPISLDVYLKEAAEENATRKGSNPDNYSNLYRLQTICHPDLNKYAEWYASGKKVWPDDIEMTPTVLKNWYVCDGHYKNTTGDNYITISMSNEYDNTDKIETYFKTTGLPIPTWQKGISTLNGIEFPQCVARWSVNETQTLFDYMGDPLPGYRYKFPNT